MTPELESALVRDFPRLFADKDKPVTHKPNPTGWISTLCDDCRRAKP